MQNPTTRHWIEREKMDTVFHHSVTQTSYVVSVRRTLLAASSTLGFNARFDVHLNEHDKLHIVPKNESAERMLTRYECIETMYELGRD